MYKFKFNKQVKSMNDEHEWVAAERESNGERHKKKKCIESRQKTAEKWRQTRVRRIPTTHKSVSDGDGRADRFMEVIDRKETALNSSLGNDIL